MIARPVDIFRHGFFSSVDEVCAADRAWLIMPATIFYVGALVIAGFLGIYLASRLGLGENMYTRMLVESASYSLSFVIWGLVAAGGAAYTKLVWGTLSGRGDA